MKIKNSAMNEFPILDPRKGVPIFYPYIPKNVHQQFGNQPTRKSWANQASHQLSCTYHANFPSSH